MLLSILVYLVSGQASTRAALEAQVAALEQQHALELQALLETSDNEVLQETTGAVTIFNSWQHPDLKEIVKGRVVVHLKGFSVDDSAPRGIYFAAPEGFSTEDLRDQAVRYLQRLGGNDGEGVVVVFDGDWPATHASYDGKGAYSRSRWDMTGMFTRVLLKALVSMPKLVAVGFNLEEGSWNAETAQAAWQTAAENLNFKDRVHIVQVSEVVKEAAGTTFDQSGKSGWKGLGVAALQQTKSKTVIAYGMGGTTQEEYFLHCRGKGFIAGDMSTARWKNFDPKEKTVSNYQEVLETKVENWVVFPIIRMYSNNPEYGQAAKFVGKAPEYSMNELGQITVPMRWSAEHGWAELEPVNQGTKLEPVPGNLSPGETCITAAPFCG